MDKHRKKLFYHGSDTEVLQGDYIQYKTLFLRKSRFGWVSYIPEHTALELADKKLESDDWLIELSNGIVTGWIYHPEELQPSKRITFIKRGEGEYKGMTPQELEELENSEEYATTWWESALMFIIILGVFVLVALLF